MLCLLFSSRITQQENRLDDMRTAVESLLSLGERGRVREKLFAQTVTTTGAESPTSRSTAIVAAEEWRPISPASSASSSSDRDRYRSLSLSPAPAHGSMMQVVAREELVSSTESSEGSPSPQRFRDPAPRSSSLERSLEHEKQLVTGQAIPQTLLVRIVLVCLALAHQQRKGDPLAFDSVYSRDF